MVSVGDKLIVQGKGILFAGSRGPVFHNSGVPNEHGSDSEDEERADTARTPSSDRRTDNGSTTNRSYKGFDLRTAFEEHLLNSPPPCMLESEFGQRVAREHRLRDLSYVRDEYRSRDKRDEQRLRHKREELQRSRGDTPTPPAVDDGFDEDDGEPEVKKRADTSCDQSYASGTSDIPEVLTTQSGDVSDVSQGPTRVGAADSAHRTVEPFSSSPVLDGLTVAIPIKDGGDPRRDRYLSTTSISTSCTSGIGTCSSVEDHDHSDFELNHTELATHHEEMTSLPPHGHLATHQEEMTSLPPQTESNTSEKYELEKPGNMLADTENATAVVTTSKRSTSTRSSKAKAKPLERGLDGYDCDCKPDSGSFNFLKALGYAVSDDDDGDGNDCKAEPEGMDCDAPLARASRRMRSRADDDVTMDDDDDADDSTPTRVKMRNVLREYVSELPLPTAMRHYLLFYRM